MLHVLIIEGHPVSDRPLPYRRPTRPGTAYAQAIEALASDVRCTILDATTEGAALPAGQSFSDFDGFVWGGSALHLYDDNPIVGLQVDLAKSIFEAGRPGLASCWGLQVVTAAAGGEVEKNPKGTNFGVARRITLEDAAADHPLHQGRPKSFDAACAHSDIVTRPPDGATVLAASKRVPVQSIAFNRSGSEIWGLQFHPEFDLETVGAIARIMTDTLAGEGLVNGADDTEELASAWEACHEDPTDKRAAWRLGIDEEILDPATRMTEIRNWLEFCRQKKAERGG